MGVSRDPLAALAPNPPDAPAFKYDARSLMLNLPMACVCCLGPPGRLPLQVVATSTDVYWGQIASSILGVFSFFATGVGWVYTSHSQKRESILRCPACDDCRKHEEVYHVALLIGGALALIGFVASMYRLKPTLYPGLALGGGWAVGGLVLAIVAEMLLGGRRGPTCAPHRPVRVSWRSEGFRLTLGNQSWGRRLAELNARSSLLDTAALPERAPAPVAWRTQPAGSTAEAGLAGPPPVEPAALERRHTVGRPSGRLIGAPAGQEPALDTPHALGVYPGTRLTGDALSACAEALELGLYEARQLLDEPLPRVVRVGPRAELRAAADRLAELGIVARVTPAEPLLSTLRPRRVRRVEALEPDLVVSGPDGNEDFAPVTTWTVPPGPRLVVVGKWLASAGLVGGDTVGSARFLHVWVGEDERPFELVEPRFLDWGFLGERKSASARSNMNLLIDILCAAPEACRDESLLTHAGRVPRTVELGLPGAQVSVGAADVISRLIRLAWQERGRISAPR